MSKPGVPVETVKYEDASRLLDVERRIEHAARPGFRITELTIAPSQQVPRPCPPNVRDTFYVIQGQLRLFLRDPKEDVRLGPGETYSVQPRPPHPGTNGGGWLTPPLVVQLPRAGRDVLCPAAPAPSGYQRRRWFAHLSRASAPRRRGVRLYPARVEGRLRVSFVVDRVVGSPSARRSLH